MTQPAHPTRSAFIRASTLSLGSIAFGSLIVTILELIRLLIRAVRDNAAGDNRVSFKHRLVTSSTDYVLAS